MKPLRCLCAILWVLFYNLAKGERCGMPEEDVDKFSCPKLCHGSQCTSNVMQSYTATDMTKKVRGCIGDGLLRTTTEGVTIHEENHIIYSKTTTNSAITKLYLTISEDATQFHSLNTNIKREFNFFLLSTSPVTWVVSYEQTNAKYNFYVNNDESQALDYYSDKLIESTYVPIHIATITGELYFPGQIRSDYCSQLRSYLNIRSCSSYITSLLNLNRANMLQIVVGAMSQSNEDPQKCRVPETEREFKGDTNKLKAWKTMDTAVSQSCTGEKLWMQNTDFYSVHVSNNTSNSTIKLRLFGASLLSNSSTVLIALRSDVPVVWEASEANSNPISANVTFVVSSNSNVNITSLNASRVNVVTSAILDGANDTQMLIELASEFDHPIEAYAKFNGNPNLVDLKLVDSSNVTTGAVEKPKEDFFHKIMLDEGFNVSSSKGARLSISCEILTLYKLKVSDLKIGNGSCPLNYADGEIVYSNLTRCGLQRVTYGDFEILVTVRDVYGEGIRFRLEPSAVEDPSMIAYTDITRQQPVTAPQLVTESQSTFFTKIGFPVLERYGISSMLGHCYLRQNDTNICSLIQDNCPVNDYVNFLVHSRGSANNSTGFSFSFAPLLESNVVGKVELVCTVSKCLVPHPNLTWSSALPRCPPESNMACEARSVGTDLDSRVEKSVSMFFIMNTGQSSTAVWTSSTTSMVTPCIVRKESLNTWMILFTLLIVVVLLLALFAWIRRKKIATYFIRKRFSPQELRALGPYNNHSDVVEMQSDQCSSLINTRSPSLYNLYDEKVEVRCHSGHCCGDCPLINSKQLGNEIESEMVPPSVIPARSKEDSTSSSTSSDSGVVDRRSLNGSIDDCSLRESNV